MTLDLTVFDLDRETHVAIARFIASQVEAQMQEGVDEWTARTTATNMAVALLLFTLGSVEDPPWRP